MASVAPGLDAGSQRRGVRANARAHDLGGQRRQTEGQKIHTSSSSSSSTRVIDTVNTGCAVLRNILQIFQHFSVLLSNTRARARAHAPTHIATHVHPRSLALTGAHRVVAL